jgi:hypothetical protein
VFRILPPSLKDYIMDALIAFVIVTYIVLGWNWIHANQSSLEPGQGKTEYILNSPIHQDQKLHIFVRTQVDQSECNVTVHRHLVNAGGHEVFEQWVQIPKAALLKLKTGFALEFSIPRLDPGRYYYISDVHLTCPGGLTYLRTTDYLPFEIIP